jgi:hypothetical protein
MDGTQLIGNGIHLCCTALSPEQWDAAALGFIPIWTARLDRLDSASRPLHKPIAQLNHD